MINYSVHSCNFIVGERWLQSLPEKERNADPRRQGSYGI